MRGPSFVAITPDGKTAYVVNMLRTVSPIDTATNKAGKNIRVDRAPVVIVSAP